jgi:hypothetical protein
VRTSNQLADDAAVFSLLSKHTKLTQAELAEEEQRTTAIGLCLQAERFLNAAKTILKANDSVGKIVSANGPGTFLLLHGVELTLKAWLRKNGKSLLELRSIGHDLSKAFRNCKGSPLPIDEDELFLEWVRLKPALHLTDTGVGTEEDKALKIPKNLRRLVLLREFLLLDNLHGKPYVLRYHRSDIYKYPDIDLALFYAVKLCEAIRPFCQEYHNNFEKKS